MAKWCVLVFMVMRLVAANDPTTCSTADGDCSATGSSILQVGHHASSTDVEGDSEIMDDHEEEVDEEDDEKPTPKHKAEMNACKSLPAKKRRKCKRAARKTARASYKKSQKQEAINQKDLIVLAGASDDQVDLSASAMKELGWQQGISVVDTSGNGTDHAWTWRRGKQCVASFSAANDKNDVQQVIGGANLPPVAMCGFQMHAGVAQEMMQFMKQPQWGAFIAYLNDGKCKFVTSVGHSLGGGLATALAACANAGIKGFGERSDFRLVTFAAVAISTETTYSGTPGTPFVGTRYSVVDSTGNGMPSDTKQFRLDLLQFFATVAEAMGHNSSKLIAAHTQFSSVPRHSTVIESLWKMVAPEIKLLHLAVMQLAQVGTPEQKQLIGLLVQKFAAAGYLFYEHDFVPSLLVPFGFKHALVNYQPLTHPVKAPSASSMKMVDAVDAVDKPSDDLSQSLFAYLANKGSFPNHQACCYFKGNDCASYFAGTYASGKTCTQNPMR